MKANEVSCKSLMIGDWVYRPDCYDQVKEIRQNGIIGLDSLRGLITFNELEPIPITPDILEKNGFIQCEPQGYNLYIKDKDGAGLYNIFWQGEYDYYLEIAAYAYPLGEFNKVNIKYVHELQHALRLCGIEKEIEL